LFSLLKKRLKNLTNNTPEVVAIQNAQKPRKKMKMVFHVKNSEAWVEAPTVTPSNTMMESVKVLLVVLAKLRVTPLYFNKLPKNNISNNGNADGTKKHVSNKPTIGKIIFSV